MLPDNTPMLAMCRALGFAIAVSADDETGTDLTLDLTVRADA